MFFLLPLLSSGSDNHTNRPTKAALRKERRELFQQKRGSDRESKANKNCSRQHKKRKFALWRSRRRQKRLARKAYRMGIFASLAYNNFRDDKKDNNVNTTTNSWEFSLIDDPPPIQYLLDESDDSSSTTQTISLGKRNRLHTFVAEAIARLQVSACQIHHKVAQIPLEVSNHKQQCKHKILKQHGKGKTYNLEWYFSDWHEKNKVKAWHDTDLIIATSGTAEIVLSFAGTASTADAVTNVQTLEPVKHSMLFTDTNSTNSIEGNIHRGFLNAYSRVSRGRIKQLNNGNYTKSNPSKSMDNLFTQCITQQRSRKLSKSTAVAVVPTKSTEKEKRKHEKKWKLYNFQVCYSRDYKLMNILRNVTTTALKSGQTVHVVGHRKVCVCILLSCVTCVQYEVLMIWVLRLNFVCLYLIVFANHMY